MSLIESWMWLGPKDAITLNEIKQIGAKGIVSNLWNIPVGDIWSLDEIRQRNEQIEHAGFQWEVVESIPIHESIKLGTKDRDKYIDNYIETIKNLSAYNIPIILYHFMPLLDWTRTDIHREYIDGSFALAFDYIDFAIFELYILKEATARFRYNNNIQIKAEKRFMSMTHSQVNNLKKTLVNGMIVSANQSFGLKQFKKILSIYQRMTKNELRNNLFYFLQRVVPICEKYDVRLAIHPDDPPMDILGIPRIVSTMNDLEIILKMIESPYNGLTLGIGSLVSRKGNDVIEITKRCANRTHFVHLRNVIKYDDDGSFIESNHLDGDADIYEIMKILLIEQHKRSLNKQKDERMIMRCDHGHMVLGDINSTKKMNAGYTLYGRMKGLCELRGLQIGLQRCLAFSTHLVSKL